MTPDELRAMTPEITLDEMTAIGREAGLVRAVGPKRNAWHGWEHELHTFAILVGVRERRALLAEVEALRKERDTERESCAKLCELVADKKPPRSISSRSAACECAALIRARSYTNRA